MTAHLVIEWLHRHLYLYPKESVDPKQRRGKGCYTRGKAAKETWQCLLGLYEIQGSDTVYINILGSSFWMEAWAEKDLHRGWEQEEEQDIDSPHALKFKNPQQYGMDSSCWKKYARQTRGCTKKTPMQAHFHGNLGSYKIKDVMIWVFLLQHTTYSAVVMWLQTWNAKAERRKKLQRDKTETETNLQGWNTWQHCQSTAVWNV